MFWKAMKKKKIIFIKHRDCLEVRNSCFVYLLRGANIFKTFKKVLVFVRSYFDLYAASDCGKNTKRSSPFSKKPSFDLSWTDIWRDPCFPAPKVRPLTLFASAIHLVTIPPF